MGTAIARCAALGLATMAATGEVAASPVAGVWARGDGKAHVRIAPCGETLCAVNTWIREGTQGEKVGDRLVMTLETASATELSGTAFDPQRNLTYRIEISHTAVSMTTRGCVLYGLLCKSVGWTRIG